MVATLQMDFAELPKKSLARTVCNRPTPFPAANASGWTGGGWGTLGPGSESSPRPGEMLKYLVATKSRNGLWKALHQKRCSFPKQDWNRATVILCKAYKFAQTPECKPSSLVRRVARESARRAAALGGASGPCSFLRIPGAAAPQMSAVRS